MKIESGTLRELIEVTDCRDKRILGRFPVKYFDAAFDIRWIRATKIITPGQQPGKDRLAIGIIAAEELTREEFEKRLEEKVLQRIVNEANEIINPDRKCPICKSKNAELKVKTEYGHGDSTFEAYIECLDCRFKGPSVTGWGKEPETEKIRLLWNLWKDFNQKKDTK